MGLYHAELLSGAYMSGWHTSHSSKLGLRPARSLSWWIIADSVDLGILYSLLQVFSLMASHLLMSDIVMRSKGIDFAMQLSMNVPSA